MIILNSEPDRGTACFGIGCTRHTCCRLYAAIETPHEGQQRIPSCTASERFIPIQTDAGGAVERPDYRGADEARWWEWS